MKIGIDLSLLQTGHRFRGIGAVLINFINSLSDEQRNTHSFVFFLDASDDEKNVVTLLDSTSLQYEIRLLAKSRKAERNGKLGRISKLFSLLMSTIEFNIGDARFTNEITQDIGHFIQFDQSQKLPKGSIPTTIILYDIIPYIMEDDYLRGYRTARRMGRTRRSALKCALRRHQYITKLHINCRRASHLIAISENTKQDFVGYVGVKSEKITVAYLGADSGLQSLPKKDTPIFDEYASSVWGPIRRPVSLSKKPFLLFMGGADPRRRIDELAAAYNNLRARGYSLSLVLAGDTMLGLQHVPHERLRNYLDQCSDYLDDIHFLGFVSDEQRAWLYENALCYVYPSAYEGFGLPVLEAMKHGTPVITYKNSSLEEVGGSATLYADDFLDITSRAENLLTSAKLRSSLSKKARLQADKFTWRKFSDELCDIISSNSDPK